MNKALRAFGLAISVAALLPGCGKKQKVKIEAEAERSIPAEERMPSPAPPPGAESDAATTAAAVPEEKASNADFEAWFKKYGLDLSDDRMLAADPDGDGFSNKEEFLADTDPKDPNSRPGVSKSMRVKEYTEVNLPFVLRGVEGSTATVEFTEGAGRREKIKAGETIRGTKLHVDRVTAGTDTDKHGDKVDTSQVILTDSESQDRIVAVKDLPTRTSASFATLTDPEGKTTINVREGDVFAWPSEPDASYKVIDLRKDQVIVKDEKTGKTVTIQRQ